MPKFRKKPVVIEAMQLEWSTWGEMCKFADVGELKDGKPEGCFLTDDGRLVASGLSSKNMGMLIPTLEGLHIAKEHDWIIRGVKGELYPCKPDIFDLTYERISDD